MKSFRNVLQNIRENFDTYFTFLVIIVAVVVAVLDIWGVIYQSIISATILATLSLVLVGLLQNKGQNSTISRTLKEITRSTSSADLFLEKEFDRESLKAILPRSQKVYFWSVTFSTTLRVLRYKMEEALLSGTEIRILLVNPEILSSEESKFLDEARMEKTSTGIRNTLTMLAEISASTRPEKLEIRLVDYVPPWGMLIIDPHLQTGLMKIRLNTIHVPGKTRPSFTLFHSKDKEWFEFFLNQHEIIWNKADPIDLQAYISNQSTGEQTNNDHIL